MEIKVFKCRRKNI